VLYLPLLESAGSTLTNSSVTGFAGVQVFDAYWKLLSPTIRAHSSLSTVVASNVFVNGVDLLSYSLEPAKSVNDDVPGAEVILYCPIHRRVSMSSKLIV